MKGFLKTLGFTFFLGLGAFALFAVILLILVLQIPDASQIKGCLKTKMFEVSLCPNDGNYVRLNQISPVFRNAVVLSEDAAFFQHNGFDFDEIRNSVEKNLSEGKFARGGSTISQQLARNVFLTQEKTLTRKLKEAFLTYQIEKLLSKNEILERYLNVVQLGRNIFGVRAAAQFYFKKHPSQLTPLEAAFLAVLLPSPERYSVSFEKKKLTPFLRKRVREICLRLNKWNKIDQVEYELAMEQLDSFPWNQNLSTEDGAPAPEEEEAIESENPLDEIEYNGSNSIEKAAEKRLQQAVKSPLIPSTKIETPDPESADPQNDEEQTSEQSPLAEPEPQE